MRNRVSQVALDYAKQPDYCWMDVHLLVPHVVPRIMATLKRGAFAFTRR